MGGRGGSGGSKGGGGGMQKQINAILSPMSREDYIERLKVIAENEYDNTSYNFEVSVRDWENYGKSRTYLKINAYRKGDDKFHHSVDYGYYDNKSNSYSSANKHKDLSSVLRDIGGNHEITSDNIKEILKRRKK